MTAEGVVVLGIPIPSFSPVFLGIVSTRAKAVHCTWQPRTTAA